MQILSVSLGFLIGLSLGLMGGGGSILTVPLFVYVLGFEPKDAIAMSLAVTGVTSLAGAIEHWREGHVNFRVAGPFGTVAMGATYLGTLLAASLTGAQQLMILATVMLLAARFLLGRGQPDAHEAGGAAAGGARRRAAIAAAAGLVVGLLTGLVGVGGGFLIVPALLWAGLPFGDAVGTSLLTIAMNCVVGFYGYVGQAQIAWVPMALVAGGTLPGMALGTFVMRFVSERTLRRCFAALLFCVASYILYRDASSVF